MATEAQDDTVGVPLDPAADLHVAGHRLRTLVDGPSRLEALIALIDGARHDLRLLYYIFAHDAVGARVRDALIAARARGVTVSLIVDGFGSEDTAEGFFAPLREAGGEVCRFLPRYGRRYLLRNHQKMAVADDARALIGGFNVEQAYFADADAQGWRDFGMLVEGKAVKHLAGYHAAIEAWTRDPKAKIRTLNRIVNDWSQKRGALRWLFGGPTRRLSPWALSLQRELRIASRLDMIAAYFAPNPGALRRVGRMARRGRVRIITAAKSDSALTIAAARHCYPRLLRRGTEILEYQPTRLHTKLYVVDDCVYIGSANFDMRSLYLNLEIMLRIEDRGLAERVRAHIDGEAADSRRVDLALIRDKASWWTRLKWRLAYFVVAMVDVSVTRRINFGALGSELE